MKLPGYDLVTNNFIHSVLAKPLLLSFAILLAFSTCKNADIEYIHSLSEEQNMPVLSARDYRTEYSDSGKIQIVLKAPLAERYEKEGEEGQYYEFSEGIEVQFYGEDGQVESILTANYAKYFIEKNLGVGRDSVVARSLEEGNNLQTEELFWNQEKHTIYSKVFTKITNEEGTFYGEEGFEADESFENYKLIGSGGDINIEDEELP